MGDLHFSIVSSPGTHRDIIREVNSWEYRVQGKLFKGSKRPVLNEHKHYVARLHPDIKNQFIRDMNVSQGIQESKDRTGNKLWFISRIFNLFARIAGFTPIKRDLSLPQKYGIKTWKYNVTFGYIARKPVKVATGGYREVL